MQREQKTTKENGFLLVNMAQLNVMETLFNFVHKIELPKFMLLTMNYNKSRLLNA